MPETAADREPTAVVRRVLRAPAARVFQAWIDPDAMAEWMTLSGTATATLDVRVGGTFHLVMGDEHTRIEHTGEYRAIEPPRLLVFSWRSEFTGMRDTLVTVRLTELGPDETELVLTHEFATREQAESHEQGWNQLVVRLATLVEPR